MGKVHGDIIAFPLVKSGNISRKLLTKIIKKKTKVLSGYSDGFLVLCRSQERCGRKLALARSRTYAFIPRV